MRSLHPTTTNAKYGFRYLFIAVFFLSVIGKGFSQTTIFSENWSTSSYATQGWTFAPSQGNWTGWTSYTPTGGTAPNAFFNWTPTVTNYHYALISPVIDATAYGTVTLDYLLQLNNFSTATLEQFKVDYRATGGTWITLENFTNAAGTFNATRTNQALTGMGNTTFQLRFTAYGANSFNINGWGLDNIVVHGSCTGEGEICNGIDDDCNGMIDDGVVETISIAADGATTFCEGGSVMLTATYSGTTVQWKKDAAVIAGATNATYTVTTKGAYSAATSSECGSAISSDIGVTVQKLPPALITAGGATTFCPGGSVVLTANAGTGFAYQWYKGATAIAGATNISYTASTSGSYSCNVVKTATGCSRLSNVIIVVVSCKEGDMDNSIMSLNIYPNPASEKINVSVNATVDPSFNNFLTITDMSGKIVDMEEILASSTDVNISQLAAGVYYVKISFNGNELMEKFIRQ